MKKIALTISLIILTVITGFSQTVNNVPIKDIDVEYIEIVGTARFLSNKISVEIDFGQENKLFKSKNAKIKDEEGKKVSFNSMIDALNFMSKNGYDFVQAYAFSIDDQNIYHYLMRKSKK